MSGSRGNRRSRSTIPWSRSSADSYFQGVTSSQPVIKINHVHEQWRRVNQAVNSIQDPAMPGNGDPHVFDTDIPFDHADGQVTQLPSDADDKAGQDEVTRGKVWKRKAQHPRQ